MTFKKNLKALIRGITPPLVYNGVSVAVKSLFTSKKREEPWGEKTAEWYNTMYESKFEYHKHYTESGYYFLWTIIAERMKRKGVRRILDLGCGPGQFGSMLYDKGFRHYFGLDLSRKCVELAEQKCPRFQFMVGNVLHTDVLESQNYDCIVACEFLEHVEQDLAVLKRVRKGAKFFGTVPDFPWVSHVRHFSSEEAVKLRYKELFSSFYIESFVRNSRGAVFYVIEGTKL
jgi:ubiquinone/menaquinone biosynthesis C-methylase UbiE